jgi:hypothetical protein
MGGDLRGADLAVCKIAGLRLPRFESWSCHNPPDLRKRGYWLQRDALGNARISLHFRSARRGADADPGVPRPLSEGAPEPSATQRAAWESWET